MPEETRQCKFCNEDFTVRARNSKKVYCSNECERQSKREAMEARWQDPSMREKFMEGLKKRSESDNWRNTPHFQRGEKNPRYQGGKRRERQTEMARYEYKQWRLKVFKRDDYTCQECHQRGGFLIAHHIQHWATHPELRYETSNGVTLCERCHDAKHGLSRKHKVYKCELCGGPKKDGRSRFCKSCGSIQGFPEHLRAVFVIRECSRCGKEIKRRSSNKSVLAFCDNECRFAYARGEVGPSRADNNGEQSL